VPASTTAVVRYEAREIELRPLLDEPDPHFVELCSPPRGWTIAGDTVRLSVSPEPAGRHAFAARHSA